MTFYAMTLDMHVTLGELLSAAATIVAVAVAFARLGGRLDVLEFKVNDLWERRSHRRD